MVLHFLPARLHLSYIFFQMEIIDRNKTLRNMFTCERIANVQRR